MNDYELSKPKRPRGGGNSGKKGKDLAKNIEESGDYVKDVARKVGDLENLGKKVKQLGKRIGF